MKWVTVVLLLASCCAAENVSIRTAKLSTSNAGTHPRIIGGTNTTIEKYPYIVQVQLFRSAICGGSLITVRHVLSAAHCFYDRYGAQYYPSAITIRAGTTMLGIGGTIHPVAVIINHERYNRPVPNDNDIAVLLLTTSVTVGPRVGLARIPYQGEELESNTVVKHLGWGNTDPSGTDHIPSLILQEVEIRTVGFQECFSQYQLYGQQAGQPGQYPITGNMICAGLMGIGGKDACQGDSGGPLQYGDDIVVGVTSWGAGCGDPRYPGVNAKVSAYANWIAATVSRYNASPPVGQISGILMLVSLLASLILSSKI